MTDARPLLVDLKRGSLDDGPGLRSVVFFKGCPLRCAWCQNPETLRPGAELQRWPERCAGCGACQARCPLTRARPARQPEPELACQLCGACVEACPAAARRIAGEAVEPAALASRLLRDRVFWRRSGGGVTLSGGEPTLHPAFAGELAGRLRASDVHVLLETCGQFRWEPFAERLLPHLSAIYFDLKLADPEQHRRWTGVDGVLIKENLRRLADRRGGLELLPRIPLVPGLTDSAENLGALAQLCRELGLSSLALLPYNPLWIEKRRALGLDLPYAHERWMTAEELARARQLLESTGLQVIG